MSRKLELHKISGDENTIDERYKRTLNTKGAYERCVRDFEKVTWKVKAEPKSSWYPHTPDQHVYGVKK